MSLKEFLHETGAEASAFLDRAVPNFHELREDLRSRDPEAAVLADFLAKRQFSAASWALAEGLSPKKAFQIMEKMIALAIYRGRTFEGDRRYSVSIPGSAKMAETIANCLAAPYVFVEDAEDNFELAPTDYPGLTIERHPRIAGPGWDYKVVKDFISPSEHTVVGSLVAAAV